MHPGAGEERQDTNPDYLHASERSAMRRDEGGEKGSQVGRRGKV